jgi:tetratricopeptide (TPR) repeat protein
MNKTIEKALAYIKSGKYKPAQALLYKINLDKKQTSYQSLRLEAICCIEFKLYEKSEILFKRALELADSDALTSRALSDLGMLCLKQKQGASAIAYLNQAIALLANNQSLELRFTLAKVYIQQQDYAEATKLLKALLIYQTYTVKVLCELLNMAMDLSDYNKTVYYLKQLEAYFDRLDLGQISLLLLNLQRQRDIDLSLLMEKARDKGVDQYFIQTIQSRILIEKGKFKEALVLLNDIPIKKTTKVSIITYHELKAQALLKLKKTEEAFANFTEMNRASSARLPKNWQSYDNLAANANIGPLVDRRSNYRNPIDVTFLVGFPRSGTTLLENVIDSQQSILTLGERPTIDRVMMKIKEDGYKYPQDLNSLPDEYIDELRDVYFKAVSNFLIDDNLSDYKLVLDKNPLLMIQLPLILTLFPNAKVLLALRHPLDCILSCYMQNFKPIHHLGYFTDWEHCFVRYKEMFDLYEQYKTYMQWQEYAIRYEDLISGFEPEVEGILRFLGVEADKEAYLGFNTHAQTRVITTPSKHQVRKGIYQDAKYRWHSYVDKIEPYWQIVAPHIEKYGYASEPLTLSITATDEKNG